jgi:transposase
MYKRSKKIHLILDNYIIHKSKKVSSFLKQYGLRIKLHFLPPYSPNNNKIEIIWKHMHGQVTRNHKHVTIGSLMSDVEFFLKNRKAIGKTKISTMKMAA